ncbi:MAG: ABC transporter substrate-binding protein [Candidatus Caldarchaeum sp.]
MRVVSLVPSATDILVALGAGDEVAAVTYACSLSSKPVVVKPLVRTDGLSPEQVDRTVSEANASGRPLYSLDLEKIESLNPDLIIAQGVCDVCAASMKKFGESLRKVAPVVELNPSCVDEILQDILLIGRMLKREAEALEVVENISEKISNVKEDVEGLERVRVAFLEWLFPPFSAGHWVPELVEIAGGLDIGVKGLHSRRLNPDEIMAHRPERLVAGPCGYSLDRSYGELVKLVEQPWAAGLKAVGDKNLYAVDADKYFSRHGPSIGDAVLILAEIIHPEIFRGTAPENSFKKIEESGAGCQSTFSAAVSRC